MCGVRRWQQTFSELRGEIKFINISFRARMLFKTLLRRLTCSSSSSPSYYYFSSFYTIFSTCFTKSQQQLTFRLYVNIYHYFILRNIVYVMMLPIYWFIARTQINSDSNERNNKKKKKVKQVSFGCSQHHFFYIHIPTKQPFVQHT